LKAKHSDIDINHAAWDTTNCKMMRRVIILNWVIFPSLFAAPLSVRSHFRITIRMLDACVVELKDFILAPLRTTSTF
jgi:hypothetical protein